MLDGARNKNKTLVTYGAPQKVGIFHNTGFQEEGKDPLEIGLWQKGAVVKPSFI